MVQTSRSLRFPTAVLKALVTAPTFDSGAWERACSGDLHLRIGNDPVIVGRDGALERLAAFLNRVAAIGTNYCDTRQIRETIYAETEIRFLDGGSPLPDLPCVIVIRTTHGIIRDLRFYLDQSRSLLSD